MGGSEGVSSGAEQPTGTSVAGGPMGGGDFSALPEDTSSNWGAAPGVEPFYLAKYTDPNAVGLLKGAMQNKTTGAIYSRNNQDITSLYQSYMDWQHKQRVTDATREDLIAKSEAQPGRSATMIASAPNATVLGATPTLGKTVLG